MASSSPPNKKLKQQEDSYERCLLSLGRALLCFLNSCRRGENDKDKKEATEAVWFSSSLFFRLLGGGEGGRGRFYILNVACIGGFGRCFPPL